MKEYWIVLEPERYRHPEPGRYQKKQVFGPGETIECVGVPSVRLNVADLFV